MTLCSTIQNFKNWISSFPRLFCLRRSKLPQKRIQETSAQWKSRRNQSRARIVQVRVELSRRKKCRTDFPHLLTWELRLKIYLHYLFLGYHFFIMMRYFLRQFTTKGENRLENFFLDPNDIATSKSLRHSPLESPHIQHGRLQRGWCSFYRPRLKEDWSFTRWPGRRVTPSQSCCERFCAWRDWSLLRRTSIWWTCPSSCRKVLYDVASSDLVHYVERILRAVRFCVFRYSLPFFHIIKLLTCAPDHFPFILPLI